VDAVDIGRPYEVRLGHGETLRAPVNLPRPGKDHLHVRIVVPARLEQRQLAAAVDLEIGIRLLHAVDVADLPGEIEDHVVAAHEIGYRRLLADVGDVHAKRVLDTVNVEQVSAVGGNQ